MASTADTHSSVASTITALRTELPDLEQHQQRLEAELATVTGRLDAARDALRALESLSAAPLPTEPAVQAQPSEAPAAEPEGEQAAAGEESAPRRKRAAARKKTAAPAAEPRAAAGRKTAKKTAAPAKTRKSAAARKATTAAEPAPARKRTPGLTAGVLAYLAEVQEPVRAAQVTEALGRATTPANVNAVRTSLERAVKASQIQRTGRGLYQALPR